MKSFPEECLHLDTPVMNIRTVNGKVLVETAGALHEYDQVILATHGDQALSLLGDSATALEREILGAFETSANTAVLHSDTSVTPSHSSTFSPIN
jgi:predicted NAD/FAD-binding protein